jgi:hypothetical protein
MKGWVWSNGDPASQLSKLKAGLRNKAMRIAMNKAMAPVKEVVVSLTPVDTGALKKSMRIKVTNYRGVRWVGIVGPSAKFTRKDKKSGGIKRPARYNAIVNKHRRHIDSARRIAGRRFAASVLSALRQTIPQLL